MRKVFAGISVIVIALLLGAQYYGFLPSIENNGDVFAVTTFLFGIFAGFSIADRHKRIDELRDNDSIERSVLIYINQALRRYEKNDRQKYVKAVDDYLMATMDYNIFDFHRTFPEFEKVVDVVLDLNPENDAQRSIYSYSVELLAQMNEARSKTVNIIEDRLTFLEWLVFYVLTTIIVVTMFTMSAGSLLFSAISMLLILVFSSLLIILYRLDSLKWKEEARIIEPYQKTFEAVNLTAYYPQAIIDEGRVKNHLGRDYRSVTYPSPYPEFVDKKVALIKKNIS